MTDDTLMPPVAFGFANAGLQTHAGLLALVQNPELASLLDHLPAALLVTGPDDTIRLLNSSAEGLFGLRRSGLLGQGMARLREESLLDLDPLLARAGLATVTVRDRRGQGRHVATRSVIETAEGLWSIYSFTPQYEGAPARAARSPASPVLLSTMLAERVAKASVALDRRLSVLLQGETGAGKTVLARHIHDHSRRAGSAFVQVNCGSIPETLFESEVFGYERGAFTGALQGGKRGYIERAAGGTLFLDEVGEIPLTAQAKLLKFLEDGTVQTVGGHQMRQVDAGVICATNRDLAAMVAAGAFRRDLYFRLAGFCVEVPGLRESGLLPALIERQLQAINRGRETALQLSDDCHALLLSHRWEGNVRELRHALEYASIMAEAIAGPEHLPASIAASRDSTVQGRDSLRQQVRAFERGLIDAALAEGGSKREAARRLGIDVATLIRKLRDE